jgi:hypothetical protein
MWTYLGRLTLPRVVLWCYFIWYLATLGHYFDPSPSLWLNSVGISIIIGTGLVLSTAYSGSTPTRLDRWQVFRLYLMPLCVSSFAATIKDRGFVLIFHPTLADNASASAWVFGFVGLVWVARRFQRGAGREAVVARVRA